MLVSHVTFSGSVSNIGVIDPHGVSIISSTFLSGGLVDTGTNWRPQRRNVRRRHQQGRRDHGGEVAEYDFGIAVVSVQGSRTTISLSTSFR